MMSAMPLLFTSDVTRSAAQRHQDAPIEPEPYVAEEPLVEAVNLAIHLRRPLLLEGEAGCGKTRLARAVAYQLGLPYFVWPVRSTSRVQEGLYTYDAIRRLHDVQILKSGASSSVTLWSRVIGKWPAPGGPQLPRDPSDPRNYVEFGALGKAFLQRQCPAVVLIDEIDKADIDFPNDLLTILDKPWEFRISETDERVQADPAYLPIVFISSNKEKGNLPAPFLRRCLYHFLEFPEAFERLKAIVLAHHPQLGDEDHAGMVRLAVERFQEERRRIDLHKLPGTSELLDWISTLFLFRGQTYPLGRLENRTNPLPFPEVLYKVKSDFPKRPRTTMT
jgi:MoxR-like ATPase